jgi:cyclic pyranopterin phosphate synthase
MTEITDAFGRTFKTLRVSLTNTCNLGCVYCVDPSDTTAASLKPAVSTVLAPKALSVEELTALIGKLHERLQLDAVRLTGGEPTLYRQLLPLTEAIGRLGIPQIKMTSNGYLLAPKIEALQKAGLTSINISLDAVEPDVFFKVSRRRNLGKILAGIDKALELGVQVKINTVIMKGLNDDQILPLLAFTKERNIAIRFLELMQMGHLYGNFEDHFFSEQAILQTIAQVYAFTPLHREPSTTAKYWQLDDGYQFGIISNESDPFCNDCNRLRIDTYGHLYGCLSENTSVDLATSFHSEELLEQQLRKALAQKKLRFTGSKLSMLEIGG